MHTPRFLIKSLIGLFLWSSVFGEGFLSSSRDAHAKIYTYERDGVVVISSEPPPRFSRPKRVKRRTKRRAKKRKKAVGSQRSMTPRSETRKKARRRRSTKINTKKLKRRAPWTPPKSIELYQDTIKNVAKHYQLPTRLLWSVLSACHSIKRHSSMPEMLKTKQLDRIACISDEVRQQFTDEISTLLAKTKIRSTQARRGVQQIFGAGVLLRRLINYYRGDVTLVLSAYPHAAYWSQHPVFVNNSRTLSVDGLLNKSSVQTTSPVDQTSKGLQRVESRFVYLTFSRMAITLYHRLLEET